MSTLMRRTLTLTLLVFLVFPCSAAIKFFSDYPNSLPADSDFFVLQRNQSYVNSTPAQVRGLWFTAPIFTGNGSISGTFTAVSFFGDGSGLTGIPSGPAMTNYVNSVSNLIYSALLSGLSGSFVQTINGNATNLTLWGTTSFNELDILNAFFTNAFFLHTNWTFIGLDNNGQIIQVNPATNGVWLESTKVYLQTNTLPIVIGDVSQTPTHDIHFFHTNAANNDVVGIDSTSSDSSSMLHIKNLTAQGPFFDYESANVRWGFGVSSSGDFVLRTAGNAVDPVNGGTVITWPTNGGIIAHGTVTSPAFLPDTNAMASATNTLSFLKEDYTFVSPTAVSVTGFTDLPTTTSANILLTLNNTSGTNWNLTIPTTVLTATGTRGTVTVTNGQDRLVWFRYNPGTGHTNLVECPNF